MTTPNGWAYQVLRPGNGPQLTSQNGALTQNQLSDINGRVLVSTYQIGVPDYQLVSELPSAFQSAFSVMQAGGKYRFNIPMPDFREIMRKASGMSLPGDYAIWEIELLEVLPPLPDGARLVAGTMESKGPEAAYKEFKLLLNSSKAYFGEWEINQIGYMFLENNKQEEAITAFSYNVDENPFSANAHDSLAEAYYKAGEMAMAKKHYQKSLELNPQNSNARKMLEQLR
ncbi:MAG: tetratricopeptide repeat protein [Phaeodactylibacter sp.]|nr:tetratricopeptide repeat protein [Phaeodactylibacter sp.]MCB9265202.1 tetratricopeptide repeat protein [Lewinellaceae bacterium]MCB9285936.1 tetratricopeptide repeat protein [Lewinellaceae bacterium]